MAEIRQARLLIRDRQVTGGALPSDALMAEPFVNLYDGILKFSGVTGGSYEPSDVASVFEVGSKLYNSSITNRLSINGNFIISGDTGIISTYNGASGAGLSGKFLSGTTNGFVLGNISDIQGVTDITRVQPGVNITTGGTGNLPTVNLVASPSVNNLTFSGTAIGGTVQAGVGTFTSLSATTLSGGTILSGGTNLYSIFQKIGDVDGVANVNAGSNITTGGTSTSPTISLASSPSVNNLTFSGTAIGGTVQAGSGTFTSVSGATISGGTFYSGSTNIETIIYNIASSTELNDITRVQPGTNITTGGTANFPTVNVVSSPVFTGLVSATGFTDSSLTSGRVVYVGASGRFVDEAGFEYDASNNLLKSSKIQIGNPGDTGTTTTIYGDILVIGEAISGFTSQLYIEDNLIELNFNPSANTTSTSLGSGWSIQDGSGVAGTDVLFDVRGASTGLNNRSFATNLFDIRIRETGTVSSPNGLRLIAETDIIDGGNY